MMNIESPDRILTKYYKCHLQTKVGAVLCLVCEHFPQTSEIVTKYNAGNPLKNISNSLIICHDHPNVALTWLIKSGFGSVVECSTWVSRVAGSNPPFI